MPMNPRLLRPTAPSGFDPRRISGLAAWHDAADSTTITTDTGRVASWADKSGNGRTMANSTSGSTQPDYITAGQNGRNVIRFTAASTQRLNSASNSVYNFLHNGTPATVLVAAKVGASANPNAAFSLMGNTAAGGANTTGVEFLYDDRSGINANFNDAFNSAICNGAGSGIFVARTALLASYKDVFLPNIYSVLQISLDLTNATAAERIGFAQNNAASVKASAVLGTASSSNSSQVMQYGCCGSNVLPLTGDICEVLMYTKLLSAAELTAARNYLYAKWGITP
jgi:hypothetical protein